MQHSLRKHCSLDLTRSWNTAEFTLQLQDIKPVHWAVPLLSPLVSTCSADERASGFTSQVIRLSVFLHSAWIEICLYCAFFFFFLRLFPSQSQTIYLLDIRAKQFFFLLSFLFKKHLGCLPKYNLLVILNGLESLQVCVWKVAALNVCAIFAVLC